METYISKSCDAFESELATPFTRLDLLESVSTLKNNKAASVDHITNEVIKASCYQTVKPILKLFNTILNTTKAP